MMEFMLTGLASGDDGLFLGFGVRQAGPMALLPAIIAFLIYFLSKRYGVGQFRWLSMVPLAFGLFAGVILVMNISQPGYQEFHSLTNLAKILHYVALIVPILSIAGLIIYDRATAGAKRIEL